MLEPTTPSTSEALGKYLLADPLTVTSYLPWGRAHPDLLPLLEPTQLASLIPQDTSVKAELNSVHCSGLGLVPSAPGLGQWVRHLS